MVARSRFTIPAWLAVAVAACGDEPMPPVACGTIPQQTVTVGQKTLVVPCFEDPEMGALTLAAVSSDPDVATAEMLGDQVRIVAVSPGTASITVTATDPDGLAGELTFEALVPNRAPRLLRELPPTRMHTEDPPLKLVLSEYFADPDGQQLTYGATSSDTAVASVAVTADTLVVAGGSQGEVTVSVTAADPGGLTATAKMTVMVHNRPPVVARELPPTRIQPGAPPVRLVLSEYFSDPDGEALNFGATSSDTAVASVAVTGDTLAVAAGSEGRATVTVTATDPGGLSATARMDVTVTDGGPDLLFTKVTPRSVTAFPGDTVVARFNVANVGTQSSDSTLPRVFVSADTIITTSDRELGVLDPLGPLDPSEEVSIDVEFYLSVDLPPGIYYVGMCMDVVPRETDRHNNCSPVFTITVTASSTQGASDAGFENASPEKDSHVEEPGTPPVHVSGKEETSE